MVKIESRENFIRKNARARLFLFTHAHNVGRGMQCPRACQVRSSKEGGSKMRTSGLSLLLLLSLGLGAGSKKKSVLDLSERDVHRIYEQWEVSWKLTSKR